MRSQAQAAGFEVLTWRSTELLPGEWAYALEAMRWPEAQRALIGDAPPACAQLLTQVNHFPHSVVIARGRFHRWPIWGVLSDEAWVASLTLRLKDVTDLTPRVSEAGQ